MMLVETRAGEISGSTQHIAFIYKNDCNAILNTVTIYCRDVEITHILLYIRSAHVINQPVQTTCLLEHTRIFIVSSSVFFVCVFLSVREIERRFSPRYPAPPIS